MKSNISASFHMVKSSTNQPRSSIIKIELDYDWLSNPLKWDKEKFTRDLAIFIEQSQGVNAYPTMVLVGMLTHQIDLYVKCTHQLAQVGLPSSTVNSGFRHFRPHALYINQALT
jgi:hypothetical protein